MTLEQVKAEYKKRFNKEITDSEAQKWLESQNIDELADDALENVSGGVLGNIDDQSVIILDDINLQPEELIRTETKIGGFQFKLPNQGKFE